MVGSRIKSGREFQTVGPVLDINHVLALKQKISCDSVDKMIRVLPRSVKFGFCWDLYASATADNQCYNNNPSYRWDLVLLEHWSWVSHKRRRFNLYETSIRWAIRLNWLENANSCPFLVGIFGLWSTSDLPIFRVQSGFLSKSVHAILQVFVCSSYDLCHPG